MQLEKNCSQVCDSNYHCLNFLSDQIPVRSIQLLTSLQMSLSKISNKCKGGSERY
jgi:hypothetical protein